MKDYVCNWKHTNGLERGQIKVTAKTAADAIHVARKKISQRFNFHPAQIEITEIEIQEDFL